MSPGRPVTIVFDGSAVTSVARGFGWRRWFGLESTAMERAALPEHERKSPSKQFGVPINAVPHDYGEYMHFSRRRGAMIYYNSTMALLHEIRPSDIDDALEPISLKEMLDVLTADGDYLVY